MTSAETPPAPAPAVSWRRRLRFAYIPILAVAVLFSVVFSQKVLENRKLAAEVAAERSQSASIVYSNHQLRQEIKNDRSLAFVYQQARQWGYVRQGDRPVIIGFHYPHAVKKAAPKTVSTPREPTWQEWWSSFFGS